MIASVTGATYDIRKFDANLVRNPGIPATTGVSILAGPAAFVPNVNGLHVCGSDCQQLNCAVDPSNCECSSVTCGFCVFNGNACQCGNSIPAECDYQSASAHDDCAACLALPDASLIVSNPLAKRKSGVVEVYGVMTGVGGTITVARAVRIGRYASRWPIPNEATNMSRTVTGLTVAGFTSNVPAIRRGSRFGVYWGNFKSALPSSVLEVCIAGIVTENSGFTNTYYTSTVNNGESVDLVANMVTRLERFINIVQWGFTGLTVDTSGNKMESATVVPPCVFTPNKLTCRLGSVTKPTHEGVYEVYRPPRQLRNWHPIFYLFVRGCPDNMWGSTCTQTCNPGCVHGHCDEVCGGCVCSPGWTGAVCDTACATADNIGAACSIKCSDVIPTSTDCLGLQICRPTGLGCACRSGLQPPECTQPCATGFWGPNCLQVCNCATPTPVCNPRLGCTA